MHPVCTRDNLNSDKAPFLYDSNQNNFLKTVLITVIKQQIEAWKSRLYFEKTLGGYITILWFS